MIDNYEYISTGHYWYDFSNISMSNPWHCTIEYIVRIVFPFQFSQTRKVLSVNLVQIYFFRRRHYIWSEFGNKKTDLTTGSMEKNEVNLANFK